MSKPYSADDFSSQINEDLTWRLREISDLKSAANRSDASLQRVLLRAIVAVCYAHWEGYVRFTATRFLEHVALRRLSYSDLDRQFRFNCFLPRLAALTSSKASIAERCTLIDQILCSSDKRFSKANPDLVNTGNNLNSNILRDICIVCGLADDLLFDEAIFIDKILLRRRNQIAHGEEAQIDIRDLDEITKRTSQIMRVFGNALENRVQLGEYRASRRPDVNAKVS